MHRKPRKIDLYLCGILLLALFLYGWGTWNAGTANTYYYTAVKSMMNSWHNFWYAAFDPAGYITVDKPPVALWFQVISVKIFGLSGFSVVLPSVLFGAGSVYLIYRMVQPRFGVVPARLSALAMTLTPIVVADSRSNNMDATLVFFLLLAGRMLQLSAQKRSIWRLIVSFGLIGIAFNVKMLQAYMVVPAMVVYYWLATNKKWTKKTGWGVAAVAVMMVLSLIWPVAVDTTSASQRPYVGSSETNSELELAFGYNGTERLLGQTTGTGGAFPGMGTKNSKSSTKNAAGGPGAPGGTSSKWSTAQRKAMRAEFAARGKAFSGKNAKGGPGGAGGPGGGAFNIGTAGLSRLFQTALGEQISWLLPAAIIGFVSAFAYYFDRKRKWYQLSDGQKDLVYWFFWFLATFGFFSIASFFHPYYTIMLAPPVAVMFGIGIYTAYKQFKQFKFKNWQTYLLPAAFWATLGLQAYYVASYYPWLTWTLLIAGVFITIIGLGFKGKPTQKYAGALGLVTLLAAPTWWSLTPTIAEASSQIPTSGPSLLQQSQSGPGGRAMAAGGGMGGSVNTKILDYVEKHAGNAKYLFATATTSEAQGYILKSGKAVMAIGGFNGTDPSITLTQFKKLVAAGQVKYYLASRGMGGSNNTAIEKWVEAHGKVVKSVSSTTTATATPTPTVNEAPTTNKPTTRKTGSRPPMNGQQPPQGNTPGAGGPGGSAPSGQKPGSSTTTGGKSTSNTAKQASEAAPSFGGGMGGPGGQSTGTLYELSAN